MNIPVCHFCLKSGFLCQSCSDKLKKGEVTQLDLEVIKSLLELESRFPQLRNCSFHKAVEVSDLIFVFVDCKKKVPRSVWRKISKTVSEERKKAIRIVEKTSSLKAFLTQVLFPARIASINTIWLPDGSWESSVAVPAADFKRLPADPKVLETLIRDVISEKVTIVPVG